MCCCAAVPTSSLGDRVEKERIKRVLGQKTAYSAAPPRRHCRTLGGLCSTLSSVFTHPRAALTKHEREIEYLNERLGKLLDDPATEHNWLDFAETWQELIKLRTAMDVQCGQAILECICMDENVLKSLGMANHFRGINGLPPQEVLRQLKSGAGGHLRTHAYTYRRKLDGELARIARLKELQLRAVGFLGTVIVGAMVGIFNFLSRVVYSYVYDDAVGALVASGNSSSLL